MLSVFFIKIDCPQLIKYLVYLTRLKNKKSQKSHAIEEFNSIIAASQKVSYPAHIPYPQPHKLADKFSSNKNQMMCGVIGQSWDAFEKHAYAETPCCFKKSAVPEVDPCGGVEKHCTRIRYEINKYVLSMRRRCPCVIQAYSGHTGY